MTTCTCGTTITNVPDYLRDACNWACSKCMDRARATTSNALRKAKAEQAETERKCKLCGDTFPIKQFHTCTAYTQRRHHTCRDCMAAERKGEI